MRKPSPKSSDKFSQRYDYDWVNIAEIKVDPRVQRRLNAAFVDKLAQEFDPDVFGTITVNIRDDGTVSCVDGQHRVAALRQLGWDDQKVECEVHRSLDLRQEATLFWKKNGERKKVTVLELFLKRIVSQEPLATAINDIVARLGLRIYDAGDTPGAISCVAALERIYTGRALRLKEFQPRALDSTLRIALGAFGKTRTAVHGDLLLGLSLVVVRYGKEIDHAKLIAKLASSDGGALGLIGKARGLRGSLGGTLYENMAEVVVELYNRGMRDHKIKPWRS